MLITHYMDTFEQLVQHGNISVYLIKNVIARDNPDIDAYLTTGLIGATPLWVATRNNHHEVVRLLLELGADPNKRCINKGICHEEAPLHIAVGHNHTESLQLLLDHPDIEVDITMEEGVTPIFIAYQEDNLESFIMLVNVGADPNTVRSGGTPGMFMASQNGSAKVLGWLIDSDIPKTKPIDGVWIDFNLQNEDGITPFLQSIIMEKKESFQLLCGTEGVDMAIPDKNGLSPLGWTVKEGLFDMTYSIISHGLELTYEQIDQIKQLWTMWRWIDQKAITKEDIEILQKILLRVTDPRIYPDSSLNPFQLELDEQDTNWNGAVKRCRYWLPSSQFHRRFSAEDKEKIKTFLLCMGRLRKGWWVAIPKEILYRIIELFMYPDTHRKSKYWVDESEDSIDYDDLSSDEL